MASRAEQKAAARAAREARLHAATQAQARRMRLIWLGGIVLAVALVVVVIAVAVGGGSGVPKASSDKATKAAVTSLLRGIPQKANQLGNSSAPVTITEYGDLVCPVCRDFAVGSEQQLINEYVRTGKAKLVYLADETASEDANNGEFVPSQVAALAAGVQGKEWNYNMTWYYEQQSELTSYVTTAFIRNIASQIPGLNMSEWTTDLQDPNLSGQVTVDLRQMNSLVQNKTLSENATPTVIFSGPKGTAPAIQGAAPFSTLKAYFKAVD